MMKNDFIRHQKLFQKKLKKMKKCVDKTIWVVYNKNRSASDYKKS